mmetsp:Transcript_13357/g.38451  ORF Transcript_13357/g.38451 Transcript_13357/m.38451 type:complete len:321 (+) Transcript_13357:243-1205(+)|eukprot:CAMPEP_0119554254 /NCGR_PEP_ID=MMETSP1352-20130426/6799_1 /TAXON_ID=265584 /ORGANISM="Stauroneis constricta, Strain CCMP1120" /LENGTH=320 /DNA_ID=CAMNT_0007600819 /DNA_START=175 /DNA_END=1137 /DNA_ORIENTATION=+
MPPHDWCQETALSSNATDPDPANDGASTPTDGGASSAVTTSAVDSSQQEDYETWLSKITANVKIEDDDDSFCSSSYDYGYNDDWNYETTTATTSTSTLGDGLGKSGNDNNNDSGDGDGGGGGNTAAEVEAPNSPASDSGFFFTSADDGDKSDSADALPSPTAGLSASSPSNASSSRQPKRKSVRFQKVELIELPITIGDNPSVSSGCPVTVEWKSQHRESCGVDDYEVKKDQKKLSSSSPKNKKKLARKLSNRQRCLMLYQNGCTLEDMKVAARQAEEIKQQRRSSAQAYQIQQNAMELLALMSKQDTNSELYKAMQEDD